MNSRATRILNRIDELAAISAEANFLSRIFGTKAFARGQQKVFQWMKQAGLQTRIDAIGNVRGRFVSTSPDAKTLVIGSHIDTVVNAGKFDGPLGVIMGLDLIENFIRTEKEIPFHLELIAFSDEEGVRFHSTFLGSRVVAGSFDRSLLEKLDDEGISLRTALHAVMGDESKLEHDAIPAEHWLGYFEIHIEQGPVLYEENIPVAVVSAIAGQQRAELTFTGMAGHAGTVPMNHRADALAGAAEFILETENFAKANDLVATVGKLHVVHSASNVIPGEVVCTLDTRSSNESALQIAYDKLHEIAAQISSRRGLALVWKHIQKTKPVQCDQVLTTLLGNSIASSGFSPVTLASGAGHDGIAISEVSPVSMLFVRCYKGISHNPLENIEQKDLEAALIVSDRFLVLLAGHVRTTQRQ